MPLRPWSPIPIVDNGEPVVLGSVGEVLRDILVDGSSKRPTGR